MAARARLVLTHQTTRAAFRMSQTAKINRGAARKPPSALVGG